MKSVSRNQMCSNTTSVKYGTLESVTLENERENPLYTHWRPITSHAIVISNSLLPSSVMVTNSGEAFSSSCQPRTPLARYHCFFSSPARRYASRSSYPKMPPN